MVRVPFIHSEKTEIISIISSAAHIAENNRVGLNKPKNPDTSFCLTMTFLNLKILNRFELRVNLS